MNNKVWSTQISMLLTLICLSMYIGLSDVILLRKANNGVLIGVIIGAIIGLIPILMYLKINNTHTNLNIFENNIIIFLFQINEYQKSLNPFKKIRNL